MGTVSELIVVFGTSSVGDCVRDTACDVSLGWIRGCVRAAGWVVIVSG